MTNLPLRTCHVPRLCFLDLLQGYLQERFLLRSTMLSCLMFLYGFFSCQLSFLNNVPLVFVTNQLFSQVESSLSRSSALQCVLDLDTVLGHDLELTFITFFCIQFEAFRFIASSTDNSQVQGAAEDFVFQQTRSNLRVPHMLQIEKQGINLQINHWYMNFFLYSDRVTHGSFKALK